MARAMLSACHNSLPAALRVYEMLLARRAPGVPDAELSQVRLRVRCLLRCCSTISSEMQLRMCCVRCWAGVGVCRGRNFSEPVTTT